VSEVNEDSSTAEILDMLSVDCAWAAEVVGDRITELEAQFKVYASYPTPIESYEERITELEAELACYKAFADNYIEKRYANLPKLKADLKELEDGRA
jgi:hypothetical protein